MNTMGPAFFAASARALLRQKAKRGRAHDPLWARCRFAIAAVSERTNIGASFRDSKTLPKTQTQLCRRSAVTLHAGSTQGQFALRGERPVNTRRAAQHRDQRDSRVY